MSASITKHLISLFCCFNHRKHCQRIVVFVIIHQREAWLTCPELMLSLMRCRETVTKYSTLFLSPGEKKTLMRLNTEEHYMNITPNTETWIMREVKWKTPFFCSVRRGHHPYLEKTFTFKPCWQNVRKYVTYCWSIGVLTYISSRVLLFWCLPPSAPVAVSIFLPAYLWKENTWIVLKTGLQRSCAHGEIIHGNNREFDSPT